MANFFIEYNIVFQSQYILMSFMRASTVIIVIHQKWLTNSVWILKFNTIHIWKFLFYFIFYLLFWSMFVYILFTLLVWSSYLDVTHLKSFLSSPLPSLLEPSLHLLIPFPLKKNLTLFFLLSFNYTLGFSHRRNHAIFELAWLQDST